MKNPYIKSKIKQSKAQKEWGKNYKKWIALGKEMQERRKQVKQ